MTKRYSAYLAIGSNQGNKLKNLQLAVQKIADQIGEIAKISSIYESPAWGFEGDDFFNACMVVHTTLDAETVLEKLLAIEESLGRVRHQDSGYASRTIDLDIIFYENEIIDRLHLKIPHPEMHKRKFVTAPLVEIAPSKVHPVLKKTMTVLEEENEGVITKSNQRLQNPSKKGFF